MQKLALVVQIAGALVTAFGLWQARFKLLRGQSPWSQLRKKLHCRRKRGMGQVVHAMPVTVTVGAGTARVTVVPVHDPTLPVEEQVDRLAAMVADLQESAEDGRKHIRRVERSVSDCRSWVAEQVGMTRVAAKTDLDEHVKARDQAQVLDLKVAIAGMVITAGGLVVALCATW